MKTTFSSGVIVTSEWLNGAKRIHFDGQDLDWHYDPLGLDSLVLKGPSGLDSRYVTLSTNQPNLSPAGFLVSGQPLGGDKVSTGRWDFGLDPSVNPDFDQENGSKAPRSFSTNIKYSYANGINPSSIPQKFSALSDSDLITKRILLDQFVGLVIDNGTF